jgi:hypothetical protein
MIAMIYSFTKRSNGILFWQVLYLSLEESVKARENSADFYFWDNFFQKSKFFCGKKFLLQFIFLKIFTKFSIIFKLKVISKIFYSNVKLLKIYYEL